MRFGREMDGGNERPLLSLNGSCMAFQPVSETPSAGIRLPDVIVQASAIHTHVGDGELWKHGVLLSEHNISVPV